ncbi:hypothetical protein [Anaeromyxobacter paludicola]|uniref:Phospholipase C/D domain-containing protein n=1 Tax=Anaeromyxobacter paludicola TaxID=2918171 RepID=A0ABM7X776_9BACT|nr:hypothetical protein [Anaeromyxobacter paludicola]BDG07682.1 hypothetical protein AMPC_07950 [Anaeromyxobacter paludicola]
MRRRDAWRAGALAAALLGALPARAYDEWVHQLIGQQALPADLPRDLAPPSRGDLEALRRATWAAGAGHPDPAVRRRFLARWPTEAAFDAWAWKELLGLTPEARVSGIDALPPAQPDARALAAEEAREPDEDRRNQERFAHDAARDVRRDAWGRPLPADPTQLDMGALTGLSSQAWAHYGLPRIAFSEDPEVLKRDPRRFAWPRTARALAPEEAQLHTDLALAAAALGTPGARALSFAYLGQAEHYLADVANQIHTIQVIYPFFVSAKLESLKEEALSLGGLLRARPGFLALGLGIVKNHHLFLESLWAKRMAEAIAGRPASPEVEDGLRALGRGDAPLEAALDARGLSPDGPFALEIGRAVVDASSFEGGPVYEAARAIASPRLSRAGVEFAGDPDAWLRRPPDPAALARFHALEGRGFARAGTALRRHAALFRAAVAGAERSPGGRERLRDLALGRLVSGGLEALEAREARLAAWKPRPPEAQGIAWAWPCGAAGLAAALALVAVVVARRRRARRRRELA